MPRAKKSKKFDNLLLKCNNQYGWAGDIESLEHVLLARQQEEGIPMSDCVETVPLWMRVEGELRPIPIPKVLLDLLDRGDGDDK